MMLKLEARRGLRIDNMSFNFPRVLVAIFLAGAVVVATCSRVTLAAEKEESPTVPEAIEVATFAGGCFWCVESDFDGIPGVVRTVSGYTGGHVENPTYRQVSSDTTGHREAVQIYYDPERVEFSELLEIFWRTIDPTDAGGQFCDRGYSYTTAIFANTAEQRRLAELSKKTIESSGVLDQPVVATIETAGPFYPAEDYHQDYYKKSPLRYKFYRFSCGRDARVKDLWGEEAFRGLPAH